MTDLERVARAICLAEKDDPDKYWPLAHGNYDIFGWEMYKETARAAIAAMGDGWQPIETAPKDGTPVLACHYLSPEMEARGFRAERGPYVCQWSPNEGIALRDGPGDWCVTIYGRSSVVGPTHWRPLPSPPAAPSSGSDP